LKSKLEENLHIKDIIITQAGCVISSHCGPNTIGILYIEK
jgi:fatty acid-binding protein DegV